MDERCERCNRKLKDSLSIERGFGKICWGKVQAEEKKKETEEQMKIQTANKVF